MPIYTRTGDAGTTRLLLGGRVSKADSRCEAYGQTDAAVSAMGLARALSQEPHVKAMLLQVQREMFTVAAELATDRSRDRRRQVDLPVVTSQMVSRLEDLIDELNAQIELPNAFIVPGGSAASAALDLARTLVRTGERRAVGLHECGLLANQEVLRYLNRLSDLLFVLARYEDRNAPFELLEENRD